MAAWRKGPLAVFQPSRYHPAIFAFVSASRMTMKFQGWRLPPLGALTAASRTFQMSSSGTGSGLRRRIARWVFIASKISTGSLLCRRQISTEEAVSVVTCGRTCKRANQRTWNLALDEEFVGAWLGPLGRLGTLSRIAEEDEERGLPAVRQGERIGDGRRAEERGAFQVSAEAAGMGGEEQVLEGRAEALHVHVARSGAAALVRPGTGGVQIEAGEEQQRRVRDLLAGAPDGGFDAGVRYTVRGCVGVPGGGHRLGQAGAGLAAHLGEAAGPAVVGRGGGAGGGDELAEDGGRDLAGREAADGAAGGYGIQRPHGVRPVARGRRASRLCQARPAGGGGRAL